MNNLDTVKDDLVPVFTANIGGELVKACDARALHTYLGSATRFNDWIKDRIEKYQFVENQDFIFATEFSVAKAGRGGHNRTEYHLTLDMAKELAMVENNARGREARRYFIEQAKVADASVALIAAAEARVRVACYGLNVGHCLGYEYNLAGY